MLEAPCVQRNKQAILINLQIFIVWYRLVSQTIFLLDLSWGKEETIVWPERQSLVKILAKCNLYSSLVSCMYMEYRILLAIRKLHGLL